MEYMERRGVGIWRLEWETPSIIFKVYNGLCPPPTNTYVETLTPNVTVFEDGAFKELKLKKTVGLGA